MKNIHMLKNTEAIRRGFAWCLFGLLLMFNHSVFASLTAEVDRTKITVEDTLTLTVRLSDQSNRGEPDFSLLDSQFDVLNRYQGSRTEYSNVTGKVISYVEWVLTLAPKREGKLLIPSFSHMGFFSEAIEIEVAKASAIATGQLRDVFVETLVEKKSVYVQEQILVKYRLYFSKNVEGLDANPLELENTTIEKLKDARYRRNVNGVIYNIAEFNYAVYPQVSGELIIPAQTWQVQVSNSNRPRSLFDRQRLELKRLRTDEKRITINPIPSGFPADKVWLPATELTVAELWSKDVKDFDIGEPISRTLKISAQNLVASQLPETLTNYQGSDFKSYTEQADLKNNPTSDGTTAVRTENAAYVVSRPGTITIPAVEIPWWDTDDDTLKYAKLPERVVTIAGTAIEDNISAPPATAHPDTAAKTDRIQASEVPNNYAFWKASSILFLLLWLGTLGLWFLSSKRRPQTSSPKLEEKAQNLKERFKELERACCQNNAVLIKSALVAWVTLKFDRTTPMSLNDIRHLAKDSSFNDMLDSLEKALYQQNGEAFVLGQQLLAAVKTHLVDASVTETHRDTLAPLYQTA